MKPSASSRLLIIGDHAFQHLCKPIAWFMLIFIVVGVVFTDIPAIASDEVAPEVGKSDWAIGFWTWKSHKELAMADSPEKPVDVLYVQVGEFHSRQRENCTDEIEMRWPGKLPKSNAYVAVWRYAASKRPGSEIIHEVVGKYLSVRADAQNNGQKVVGLQIDYDCPTKHLSDYGVFLKELRSVLPKEDTLSITALLDWFTPQTDISDVLRHVNEFVPQFYDVAPEHSARDNIGVANLVDSSRWARIFNSYGRPYRIGIASFGRIIEITEGKNAKSCRGIRVLDYSPLTIMARGKLTLVGEWTSEAGETILKYKNNSARTACDCSPASSSFIKMIVPTQKSILSAYTAAKAMGGLCKGVVFFRWPLSNETMGFSQSEINSMIADKTVSRESRIESEDGLCAAVSCTDLYLHLKERFPQKAILFKINISKKLEYFLPDSMVKTKLAGSHTIDVTVPAYVGVPKIYLGRAVTLDSASFMLEESTK